MKKSGAVFILALFVGLSATGRTQTNPPNGQTLLTTEELQLYAVFLDYYIGSSGERTPLRLSYRIVPLVLNPPGRDQCTQEIGFKISEAAIQTSHLFPESIAKGRRIHLVDPTEQDLKGPRSGLMTVSEIGFDKDHRFAVLTFKLVEIGVSGGRSLTGGTRVFRKANGKWLWINDTCLNWMT
jgi:hypothetical protein